MRGHEKRYSPVFLKIAAILLLLCVLVVSCGEQEEEDLSTSISLSGKITLASDSSAIGAVTVNLTDMISNDVTGRITASDGTYSFGGLSQSRWYLIEPVPSGYTFYPEQIQVYTNVNLSDADFKGTAD